VRISRLKSECPCAAPYHEVFCHERSPRLNRQPLRNWQALLVPSRGPDEFSRRNAEAARRQPAWPRDPQRTAASSRARSTRHGRHGGPPTSPAESVRRHLLGKPTAVGGPLAPRSRNHPRARTSSLLAPPRLVTSPRAGESAASNESLDGVEGPRGLRPVIFSFTRQASVLCWRVSRRPSPLREWTKSLNSVGPYEPFDFPPWPMADHGARVRGPWPDCLYL